MRAGLNVLYILGSDVNESSQSIYKAFESISMSFLRCVNQDISNINKPAIPGSAIFDVVLPFVQL